MCQNVALCSNGLTKDKIFGNAKIKTFADDYINVTKILKFVLGGIENIVEKGQKAGYYHFGLSLQCF